MKALPTLSIILVALSGQAVAAWQSLESIGKTAEQFVLSNYPATGLQVQAAPLDSRLKLQRCPRPLEASATGTAARNGNMTVEVRCNGVRPWKLYVPVRSIVQTRVLVARHALNRGQTVTMKDLEWAEHDLNRLPYGFIDRPGQLDGSILKRPLTPGTVLIPAMFDRRQVIRRGQQVRLVANANGVKISMAGTALTNGALQQRIKVTNLSSGRTVEGIVLSGEIVEIRRR